MQKLFFIHIPKTAGTTIESQAQVKELYWGRHQKLPNNIEIFNRKIKDLNIHHFPLDFYTINGLEFLKNYDLFTVVRNPIDRIVSSYGCQWFNDEKSYDTDDVIQFNNKIINFIEKDKNETSQRYIPQYRYVYLNNEKIVKHVIKFENLEKEFSELMSLYDIDVKLKSHENKSKNFKFTKEHLFEDTINIIREHYNLDFKLFKY